MLQKNGYIYREYWKNSDGSYTYVIDTDPIREKYTVEATEYDKFKKMIERSFPGSTLISNKLTLK